MKNDPESVHHKVVIQKLADQIEALESQLVETQLRLENALRKRLEEKEHYEQRINRLNYEIQCSIRKM